MPPFLVSCGLLTPPSLSPQQNKKQQLQDLETAHKSDLAAIDAESKRRKRDLDFDLIEAKRLLDIEIASKKKQKVEEYNQSIKQIESATSVTGTDTGSGADLASQASEL